MIAVEDLAQLEQVKEFFGNIQIIELPVIKKHILTHQRLFVRLIKLKNKPPKLKPKWFYAPIDEMRKLAVPKIVSLLLDGITESQA